MDIENLAKEAFQRMDLQLDLRLEVLDALGEFSKEDYLPDFQDLWDKLEPGKVQLVEQKMYFRNDKKIFVEKKILLPPKKMDQAIEWCHKVNGHPGAERTLWFIRRIFHTEVPTKKLLHEISRVIAPCRVCAEAKPNTQVDRGLVGALPIPSMVNEILYVDFTSMDEYNGHDYVMTIVDGLSRFAQFVPCKRKLDGEGALNLIWQNWIQRYGKPREIYSDNDVRFSSQLGFWQSVMRALQVKVSFSAPRRPQSNGLCERMNRSFKQNMRILMATQKDRNWLKLVPYATWTMNNQLHQSTGFSPADLFFGRPSWIPDMIPDPEESPTTEKWIVSQIELQEKATKILQDAREKQLKRANRGRI